MTQQEFTELTGFEAKDFDAVNYAYMACPGDKRQFAELISGIVGTSKESFTALEKLLGRLRDRIVDTEKERDEEEANAMKLSGLAYRLSQEYGNDDIIDEVAEAYGKARYCARTVVEEGRLTDNLKAFASGKIMADWQ